jgi:hypothetical protein
MIILPLESAYKRFFVLLYNLLGLRIRGRDYVVKTRIGQAKTAACLLPHATVLCPVKQYSRYCGQYSIAVRQYSIAVRGEHRRGGKV